MSLGEDRENHFASSILATGRIGLGRPRACAGYRHPDGPVASGTLLLRIDGQLHADEPRLAHRPDRSDRLELPERGRNRTRTGYELLLQRAVDSHDHGHAADHAEQHHRCLVLHQPGRLYRDIGLGRHQRQCQQHGRQRRRHRGPRSEYRADEAHLVQPRHGQQPPSGRGRLCRPGHPDRRARAVMPALPWSNEMLHRLKLLITGAALLAMPGMAHAQASNQINLNSTVTGACGLGAPDTDIIDLHDLTGPDGLLDPAKTGNTVLGTATIAGAWCNGPHTLSVESTAMPLQRTVPYAQPAYMARRVTYNAKLIGWPFTTTVRPHNDNDL